MIKRGLIILFALLFGFPRMHALAEQTVPVQPNNDQVSITTVTPEPVIMDLSIGSKGNEVLALQKRLAVLGFFYTAEDGIYGANTQAAVLEFENYLRLLEQNEIDRLIEEQKTIDTMITPSDGLSESSPIPTSTVGPLSSDIIEPTGNHYNGDEKTDAPSSEPTPVPTPETTADGVADSAIQEILYGDIDTLYLRDVQFGDKGQDVTRIQRRLTCLNYLNDDPDGSFGVNTETAIKAFQNIHGLKETGIADQMTQKILFSEEAITSDRPVYNQLYLWVTGEDVKAVQKELICLGFMTGSANGTYDERTQAAVKLLETYLYELEIAQTQNAVQTSAGIQASDEPLEKQGDVDGDSELSPYEASPMESVSPDNTLSGEKSSLAEATTMATKGTDDMQVADSPESVDIAPQETHTNADESEDVSEDGNDDAFIPTGIVNAEMQVQLLEEGVPVYRETLQKGDSGTEVMRLQRRLCSLGYLTASGVDGIYGKGSENAIKSFQTRNKLEQTGIADQETQSVLFSEEAVRSIKPYQIQVSVDKQRVYVYTHDEYDEYNVLVKTFVCSTGTRDNPTPLGTFTNTGPGARWHYFKKFECWAQYAYYINGDIMFHSVLYDEQDVNTLRKGSVNQLGSRASHGCVRLSVDDAKWIWNNCSAGTTVIVY